MELMLEGNQEVVTVRLLGELVSETAQNLRDTVLESATRSPRRIVLQMREATYMDTSGLGVIVGLRQILKDRGIALEVADPSQRIHQIFRLTRMLSVFGLQDEG
jgi:anti-anti-sigma factor